MFSYTEKEELRRIVDTRLCEPDCFTVVALCNEELDLPVSGRQELAALRIYY
jgi:hypothetical protein